MDFKEVVLVMDDATNNLVWNEVPTFQDMVKEAEIVTMEDSGEVLYSWYGVIPVGNSTLEEVKEYLSSTEETKYSLVTIGDDGELRTYGDWESPFEMEVIGFGSKNPTITHKYL